MEVKDILGIEPLAEATKIVIEKTYNGLGTFLRKVFEPGSEEIGFLLKDQVRRWRLNNVDNERYHYMLYLKINKYVLLRS